MKTLKWNDSRKKMPETKCGYSELILIAYKVDDEFNPGKKCYEYAIAVYKHKNSEVVIMDFSAEHIIKCGKTLIIGRIFPMFRR